MKIILILIALVLVIATFVMLFNNPNYEIICMMLYAAISAVSFAGTIKEKIC